MKLSIACLFTVVLHAQSVLADPILYTNTESTNAISVPGQHAVVIDDVLVPIARDPSLLPLAVTSVTVVVNGTPGDRGVLGLWSYPVQPEDGSPGFGRTLIDTETVSYDGALHAVTFGNSSSVLFTVRPNFAVEPGFGLLFLGLSSGQHGAGWLWADGPDVNGPTSYTDVGGQITRFTSSGAPFPSHISFSLEVKGTPVPEPATSSLLAVGLLVGTSCRLRIRHSDGRRRSSPWAWRR